MVGKHLPHQPTEMPYNLEERLQHLKEPMDRLVSRSLVLRNPARVPCYSDPADFVYYTTKDGRLIRNEVGLAPDWTIDSHSTVIETVIPTTLLRAIRSFICQPADYDALKNYHRVVKDSLIS